MTLEEKARLLAKSIRFHAVGTECMSVAEAEPLILSALREARDGGIEEGLSVLKGEEEHQRFKGNEPYTKIQDAHCHDHAAQVLEAVFWSIRSLKSKA